MAVVQIYSHFSVMVNETPVKGGSLSRSTGITLTDNEIIDRQFQVAPETSVKVYDATEDEALGGFSFLWMETDLDVLVQYTVDPGVSDVYLVTKLKGSGTSGNMGPARILNSDYAQQLDGSVDAFDGTEDTIKEIWLYNEDNSETARSRVVIAN